MVFIRGNSIKLSFAGLSPSWFKRRWRWSRLMHFCRDKMAAISQTTFSDVFSSKKQFAFWLYFTKLLIIIRVQLAVNPSSMSTLIQVMARRQNWDKPLPVPKMASFTDSYNVCASLGLNKWKHFMLRVTHGWDTTNLLLRKITPGPVSILRPSLPGMGFPC